MCAKSVYIRPFSDRIRKHTYFIRMFETYVTYAHTFGTSLAIR